MPIKVTAQAVRKRLAIKLAPAIQAGALAIAESIRAELAPYPAPSGRKQPPKTEKQRRYIFVLLRDGKIPYRRTGQFGQRWNSRPLALGAILENRRPKAALIVGRQGKPSAQAAYHHGTWKTVDEAIKEAQPKAAPLMAAAIGKVLS